MKLFPKDQIKGVFKGFSEGGLEFHADIILKYEHEFQSIPMHGQFLIVQLENENEAVLGRITSISAQGRLASNAGEDYGLRAVAEDREILEDLMEQYLKYKVNIRVLGVLRTDGKEVIFSPSHRRLPHVGSRIAFLSDELLGEVAGHNLKDAAEFGYFALGEFIYCGQDKRMKIENWMQIKTPEVVTKFNANNLVSRRSFVFARAGFGKSNLVKLLFSQLYQKTPTRKKRGDREVPVGTIIFDPDGEYFWPDDNSKPGLCDVPHLEDKVLVFTNKEGPSEYYHSFVAGSIKLDIRRLRPSDVISIALPERQDQQNIKKLKGLSPAQWRQLVDAVVQNGHGTDDDFLRGILGLRDGQEGELQAARSNMVYIVNLLHDPSSQLLDKLFAALKAGKICVIDISQMRGQAGLILSGIILQQIFNHNQEEFTKAEPQSIPTIAVLEEAQSVLGSSGGSESPYVSWVKEGRKYDLGAVLITQQPGSISNEILSQGDNWFIFHLLSAGDLGAVKKANAHFSNDLLSALLNEPIPGNGVFWSSASGQPYPIPVRVLSFEGLHKTFDPGYNKPAANTYALQLSAKFENLLSERRSVETEVNDTIEDEQTDEGLVGVQPEDVMSLFIESAFKKVREKETEFIEQIRLRGVPWRGISKRIEDNLPEECLDKNQLAHDNVPAFLDDEFGENAWETIRKPSMSKQGQMTTWVVLKAGS